MTKIKLEDFLFDILDPAQAIRVTVTHGDDVKITDIDNMLVLDVLMDADKFKDVLKLNIEFVGIFSNDGVLWIEVREGENDEKRS